MLRFKFRRRQNANNNETKSYPECSTTNEKQGSTTAAITTTRARNNQSCWGNQRTTPTPTHVPPPPLEQLFADMEQHMAWDRILEARKVVDQILHNNHKDIILHGNSRLRLLPPDQQRRMQHIIDESNHVREMLHDLQSNENWTLANDGRHTGITVHYRHEEGSGIHTIKTQTILEDYSTQEFVYLLSLFLEADLMSQWFPRKILQNVQILAEPSKFHKILLSHIKLHLPMIADREMMAEGIGYHLEDQNAMLCLTKTITDSPYCDIPRPASNRVRMESRVIFYFQLLPGHRVRFCQISHDNLKIRFLPAFLLNYLAQGIIPLEFIQCFKKRVRRIQGTVWEHRVKVEKRELYKEIEDRVHQQLKAMNDASPNRNEESPATSMDKDKEQTTGDEGDWTRRRYGMSLSVSCAITAFLMVTVRINQSTDFIDIPPIVTTLVLIGTIACLTHLTVKFEKSQCEKP